TPRYSPTSTPNSTAIRSGFQRASSGNVKNMGNLRSEPTDVRVMFQDAKRRPECRVPTERTLRPLQFDIDPCRAVRGRSLIRSAPPSGGLKEYAGTASWRSVASVRQ